MATGRRPRLRAPGYGYPSTEKRPSTEAQKEGGRRSKRLPPACAPTICGCCPSGPGPGPGACTFPSSPHHNQHPPLYPRLPHSLSPQAAASAKPAARRTLSSHLLPAQPNTASCGGGAGPDQVDPASAPTSSESVAQRADPVPPVSVSPTVCSCIASVLSVVDLGFELVSFGLFWSAEMGDGGSGYHLSKHNQLCCDSFLFLLFPISLHRIRKSIRHLAIRLKLNLIVDTKLPITLRAISTPSYCAVFTPSNASAFLYFFFT